MSTTTEQAAAWFADRAQNTPMPGAREMFKFAADALREKAERENPQPLTPVQEWVSVKDRLPEQTDPATAVLGITKRGKCYVVYYYKAAINNEFTGFYDNAVKRDITHWMPLPEPPKEM